MIATLAMNILVPYLYKVIIDLLSSDADRVLVYREVMKTLIYVGFILVFGGLLWRLAGFITAYFQANIMRDIENDCFQKLGNHSYKFFADNFGGALVTKVNRMTRAFEALVDNFQWDLLPLMVKIVAASLVIFTFSTEIIIALVIWIIAYMIFSYYAYRWKYKFDKASAEKDSEVTAQLADSITNILNIKIFARKKQENLRFYDVSYKRYLARRKSWDTGTQIDIVQALIMSIAEVVLMYLAIKLWFEGGITVGTVVLIQFYITTILFNMWSFGRVIRNIYTAMADAEEMTEILNQEEDVKDIENPEDCTIKKGSVDIDEIDFSYDKKSKKVFENFTLNIKDGESIGLVGESGSGKSTMVKLLLRFLDVNKGSIKIDGQNIARISQEDLRRKISYVPQDPILFHRSLAENIAYGNPGANIGEVMRAAKKANIHDFIMSLPEQYNTMVGERGIKLSGGERQRVAIARAMLKDAPVIILDEATSALDSHSEKLIQDAINNLMKGRTTIIIAHRLSTIQHVDRIVVLNKGEIEETGTHMSLIRKKGKYASLWAHQAGGFVKG